MAEYRIHWQACPHIHNPSRVLFVEAASVEDAKAIAKDHIERKHAVSWFSIHDVSEAKPVPAGRVVGEG